MMHRQPSAPVPLPRIAVCFFGITRSLRYTLSSIETNVLAPARRIGSVSVHGHFFQETTINNPRSGEFGALDPDEHRLLAFDTLKLEQPDVWMDPDLVRLLRSTGDHWDDDFRSHRNLMHQLHSLEIVTRDALASGATIVAFCRPDLTYHQSLEKGLLTAVRAKEPIALIPNWQPAMGGLNDRFAICAGQKAIRAYGLRGAMASEFVTRSGLPLHSERLLRFALMEAGIKVRKLDVTASRTRVGGELVPERFRPSWWADARRKRQFLRQFRKGPTG